MNLNKIIIIVLESKYNKKTFENAINDSIDYKEIITKEIDFAKFLKEKNALRDYVTGYIYNKGYEPKNCVWFLEKKELKEKQEIVLNKTKFIEEYML